MRKLLTHQDCMGKRFLETKFDLIGDAPEFHPCSGVCGGLNVLKFESTKNRCTLVLDRGQLI